MMVMMECLQANIYNLEKQNHIVALCFISNSKHLLSTFIYSSQILIHIILITQRFPLEVLVCIFQ
jgi:hypothetical protein